MSRDISILNQAISHFASRLPNQIRIMEVCGTHTMAIHRSGIPALLPANVKLVSGPGCPVCVTGTAYLEQAKSLCSLANTAIHTFGDMLKIPSSDGKSLADMRATGADIRICYSPAEILKAAKDEKSKEHVFLAVGFETTSPLFASILKTAKKQNIENISFLTDFKRLLPALNMLISDEKIHIDAFLLPGHVSSIIGSECYHDHMNKNSTPASICGFEPEMILESVAHLLHQLVNKESRIVNLYSQAVRPEGNTHAKALMDSTYQIADSWWRGIGSISDSGLILNEHFKQFDARARFNLNTLEQSLDSCPTCKQELQYSACAEILKGSILPTDCPAFATNCTPASPLGPMMVSSEGSCAAFYKYSVRSSKLS